MRNKFILFVKDLKIVKFQQTILKEKGIAQINTSDIFCINKILSGLCLDIKIKGTSNLSINQKEY